MSSATTVWPASRAAWTTDLPTWPAPPVTAIRSSAVDMVDEYEWWEVQNGSEYLEVGGESREMEELNTLKGRDVRKREGNDGEHLHFELH